MSEALATSPAAVYRPQAAVMWLVGLLMGSSIALGAGIALGVRGDDIVLLLLGILIAACGALPLILDQARPPRQRHLLLTLISLAYTGFFALPIVTQYLMNDRLMGMMSGVPLLPQQIAAGQMAALSGLLSMYLGYALPFGSLLARVVPSPKRDWAPDVAIGVACVMIPLGWALYLGSIFGLISARFGTGFLGAISKSTFYGIALLTIIHQRFKSRTALLLLILIIPPTMGFNFFTTSKERFFMALMMVGLSYLVIHRRIPVRWILLGVMAFLLFYPVSSVLRHRVVAGRGVLAVLQDPIPALNELSQELGTYDFGDYLVDGLQRTTSRTDGLSITSVIMRDTPDPVPYQGGWTLGYIPLSYVPRALWPGKPVFEIGLWVTENYAGGPGIKSSTGMSWLGEFYMNFGYPGVLAGMLAMGVFLRLIHGTLFREEATTPAILAGVVVISVSVTKIGGGLMAPVNGTVFGLFPLLVAHLFVRNLGHPTAPVLAEDVEEAEDVSPLRGLET